MRNRTGRRAKSAKKRTYGHRAQHACAYCRRRHEKVSRTLDAGKLYVVTDWTSSVSTKATESLVKLAKSMDFRVCITKWMAHPVSGIPGHARLVSSQLLFRYEDTLVCHKPRFISYVTTESAQRPHA